MRDEAHRFGISYHRLKREKALSGSVLDNIKGIGPKTKEQLLRKFKSVEGIKKAKNYEIEKEIGKNKAELITRYFKTNKKN